MADAQPTNGRRRRQWRRRQKRRTVPKFQLILPNEKEVAMEMDVLADLFVKCGEQGMNGRQRRKRRRRTVPKFQLILRNEKDMDKEMDELANLFAKMTLCV